ncbi:peptidase M10A and M12B matrixin and adamalysin [Halobacteria archaeon AArc-m2/3/4]|uniref:Peptidase M10A and M12B matrixin and adamalysin n=1 Tax=Natronoglomus mannanivorans TaxID=2979990 RepID=A0AAP2YYJ2_9EURY|nr:peptidase M10A and M12B matrixin and adamalysin [Halobacteria archaeon AArc-xg1-1]MCU4974556.1 peptidase M10A and M12B matrixin and adamalysin [Halobacteria archaeon AArc-m2/3/4]
MKRRQFLAGLCGSCSIGGLWYVRRSPKRTIDIRFWLSARAARYEDITPRIASYLEAAFGPVYADVDVSYGGVVQTRTEHGFGVMRTGEWPARVAVGTANSAGIDPVDDVNLLVTDGPMTQTPSGAGILHLASVGGARYIGEAPPREEVDDVVSYTTPARVVQVLIHEVGHALGLAHDHGAITNGEGTTVASPMVSTYAWASDPRSRREFDADHSACGGLYPADRGGRRKLSYTFSSCATAKLREYRGGLHP